MTENKQTVVIAETSYIMRKGLVHIFDQLPYIHKVIELDEMSSLVDQIGSYNPNIIIINPNILGTIATHNLRNLFEVNVQTHIIGLITTLVDRQTTKQCFDAAITIFDTPEMVDEKIRSLDKSRKTNEVETEELSDREKEILVTLVKGLSNKEIADYHHISIHTVITHRRNITRKLNIHSPSGLTIYAIVNKLVDINDIKL